ncbi:MAG TPA: polyprenyl synthetase family protein [Candidatus Bipolaricaulis sp.]|nr:polyprenyl synthetase family protein [Candidatus Bipolaricaulis sp.]HRS14447.1 polyprenyl synthetase family protein [Candidatus Bipolaricaulis sp.]HRU21265.1 polyprenyl synthetase family protein [Candidatus Bipolaricaulis sp.]
MNILERYRTEIASSLAAVVPEEGILRQLIGYPLGLVEADGGPGPGIGGKLVRPSLVCFACEALGEEPGGALPLATAIELVHTFSLVHDDIVDGDRVRRGRPTAWVVLGEHQAIHAGDGLLALAFRTAAQADIPAEGVARAVASLAAATVAMVGGQARDLELEGACAGTELYLEMARGKTGALLGCALELGAIAARRPDLALAHRATGEALGVAFQLRDDWLGLWGDPRAIGKAVGADLVRGKRSFPIAWALERDPSFSTLLDEGTPDEARARLVELGADEATAARAEQLLARAEERAGALPWPDWARAAFRDLCRGLAARVR